MGNEFQITVCLTYSISVPWHDRFSLYKIWRVLKLMSCTLYEIQRIVKPDCIFHKLAVILLYLLYFIINFLNTYSCIGKCM